MESLLLKRRKHGCDGCHKDVSTQRFDGYIGDNLWICGKCLKKLIKDGFCTVDEVKG